MSVLIVDFDRFLMGFSLGVHIILASIGIALPVIILAAEYLGIRRNDSDYTLLARRLAIVFIIFFAVGTVSGTLVALNILLLWPTFMSLVAQVSILPFYIEVFAFFLESIFVGIYYYSWDRFKNRYAHLLTGIPLAVGSALSGVLITMINAWMNTPNGFDIQAYLLNGTVTNVQPLAVFSTPSTGIEVSHVLSAVYLAGSFIFVAYMAYRLLKASDERVKAYYRKGLGIALAIAVIATLFSVVTGIISISSLATLQPEKYAAIEANFQPQTYAPELIGGIPVDNNTQLQYYIAIPDLQSILDTGSASGAVPGLSSYPQSTWPPLIIHLFFDIMFFVGFGLGLFMAFVAISWIVKRRVPANRKILWLLIVAGAFALLILELGWVVDEVGRQPWIIYNVMLVSQAANQSSSIIPATVAILAFYVVVIPLTLWVIARAFRNRPLDKELVKA